MVKFGPTNGSLLSKGSPFTFMPDILYNDAPVSSAIKRFKSTPRPRIENGLIGVEKYPFLGMKYENDSPNSCAELVPILIIAMTMVMKIFLFILAVLIPVSYDEKRNRHSVYLALKSEKITC